MTNTHDEVVAVRRDISHLQDELKNSAPEQSGNNGLLNRASMASVLSCLSFASTGSLVSIHESIAQFVAETENLVANVDNHGLVTSNTVGTNTMPSRRSLLLLPFPKVEYTNVRFLPAASANTRRSRGFA